MSFIGGGGIVMVFIGAIGVEGAVLVGETGGVDSGVEEVGVEGRGIGRCRSNAGKSI